MQLPFCSNRKETTLITTFKFWITISICGDHDLAEDTWLLSQILVGKRIQSLKPVPVLPEEASRWRFSLAWRELCIGRVRLFLYTRKYPLSVKKILHRLFVVSISTAAQGLYISTAGLVALGWLGDTTLLKVWFVCLGLVNIFCGEFCMPWNQYETSR